MSHHRDESENIEIDHRQQAVAADAKEEEEDDPTRNSQTQQDYADGTTTTSSSNTAIQNDNKGGGDDDDDGPSLIGEDDDDDDQITAAILGRTSRPRNNHQQRQEHAAAVVVVSSSPPSHTRTDREGDSSLSSCNNENTIATTTAATTATSRSETARPGAVAVVPTTSKTATATLAASGAFDNDNDDDDDGPAMFDHSIAPPNNNNYYYTSPQHPQKLPKIPAPSNQSHPPPTDNNNNHNHESNNEYDYNYNCNYDDDDDDSGPELLLPSEEMTTTAARASLLPPTTTTTTSREVSINQHVHQVTSFTHDDGSEPIDVEANNDARRGSSQRQQQQQQPNILHAFEAELVITDDRSTTANHHDDSEAERERRLRRQAERDAEERILATAITAEDAQVIDEISIRRTARRRNVIIYGSVGIVITLIVVVVAVVVTSTTFNPIPVSNTTCDTAFGPLELFVGTYSFEGNTLERSGNFSGSCQVDYEGGFGSWYYFVGDGSRVQASTCYGSDEGPNSDTQVLVFSGQCSALTCVGGSDELCGAHGSVGWTAEVGVEYHILVRGTRASSAGNFTLSIAPLGSNGDVCQHATTIPSPSPGPLFGSTRNHSPTIDFINPCQSAANTTSPGSWYQLKGDDTVKCASLSTESGFSTIVFPAVASLFSGNCGSLKCLGTASDSSDLSWVANSDTSYHLLVQGENPDEVGGFFLNVKDAPYNTICEHAQALSINNESSGTTIDACVVKQPNSCAGNDPIEDLPGVWYTVLGTGNLIEASTCDNAQDADVTSVVSRVAVFDTAEGCRTLNCVAAREDLCGPDGNQRSTKWFSTQGQMYFILVQSGSPSSFNIAINDLPPGIPNNDTR
jgi:hypothetical protein